MTLTLLTLLIIAAVFLAVAVWYVVTSPGGARGWWSRLSDQWKATLRTALAALVAALGALLLASLTIATGLLAGGSIDDALAELSIAVRTFLTAVITVLTGIVTFWMNRNGRGARYDT